MNIKWDYLSYLVLIIFNLTMRDVNIQIVKMEGWDLYPGQVSMMFFKMCFKGCLFSKEEYIL